MSYHNYGLAIDIVLIIDGKSASWEIKKDFDGEQLKKSHPNYQKRNLILSSLKQKALKIIDEYFKLKEECKFFALNKNVI